ncbi:telomere repeats-binding bouquet formation protein 1-like isoform X2 [Ornithorhynchus anatinus]|uniref:telomere repeats-binding bouquet formation protein 1-like isoform X2 n=1 Tax=Ornithorhynchus anatinus TaxID=9258 RepID=UPI0019D4467E|nr:telomere repeats-binding bouquet formation protein 1-like isoform X2 [Ornithorhynchus anatinus]
MLLRETGCIPVLQKLFRETLIESEIDSSIQSCQEKYSLWYAVCNALTAAVNNPPNAPVQEFFISVGGLDGLADIFTKLVSNSRESIPSAKMAVAVTSTMGVCIAHNSENLLDKLLAFIPQDASEREQRNTLGCLKKTENTLLKEQFKREEDEEQGPKADVIGDSLLKGKGQEKDLPKQHPVLGAQIYHPPANDEVQSQSESTGGDPSSTLSGKQKPVRRALSSVSLSC